MFAQYFFRGLQRDSSSRERVDGKYAVSVNEFRCVFCPSQNILVALRESLTFLAKNFLDFIIRDSKYSNPRLSTFWTLERFCDVLEASHLHIIPTISAYEGFHV